MLRLLASDQAGVSSEAALDRQIDRLARVLRRSPYAVRRALDGQGAVLQQRDALLTKVKALGGPLAFLEDLLRELVRAP